MSVSQPVCRLTTVFSPSIDLCTFLFSAILLFTLYIACRGLQPLRPKAHILDDPLGPSALQYYYTISTNNPW